MAYFLNKSIRSCSQMRSIFTYNNTSYRTFSSKRLTSLRCSRHFDYAGILHNCRFFTTTETIKPKTPANPFKPDIADAIIPEGGYQPKWISVGLAVFILTMAGTTMYSIKVYFEEMELKQIADQILISQPKIPVRTKDDVFLDVSIAGKPAGRIIVQLFDDIVPKTCENFRSLCAGDKMSLDGVQRLHFKGSKIHRIVPDFILQGGDIVDSSGLFGESIFGRTFRDENFVLQHDKAGVVSMANKGPNTNSSQFFITFRPTPHLDGRHVAFGQVVQGMDVLRKIEKCGLAPEGVPVQEVTIEDCGISLEESKEPETEVRNMRKRKRLSERLEQQKQLWEMAHFTDQPLPKDLQPGTKSDVKVRESHEQSEKIKAAQQRMRTGEYNIKQDVKTEEKPKK